MLFIKDETKFAYSWDECVYLLLLKELNLADYLTPKELSTEHFHYFSVLVDILIILVFEIFLCVNNVLWWCSPHFLLQHPTSNSLCIHYHLHVCLAFYDYGIKLVIHLCSRVWGYPLELEQPTNDYNLNEHWLSFLQPP